MRLWCVIVLTVFLTSHGLAAQSEGPADRNVTLNVVILGDKHSFQIGETIAKKIGMPKSEELYTNVCWL